MICGSDCETVFMHCLSQSLSEPELLRPAHPLLNTLLNTQLNYLLNALLHPLLGVPAAGGVATKYAAETADFGILYSNNGGPGYPTHCDEESVDHVIRLVPKTPIEFSLVQHDELFDYPMGTCFDLEPECPVCQR